MAADIPKTMEAWQYSQYGGGPEVLKKVDDKLVPTPKANYLLVKIQALSVNPIDWKIQDGFLKPALPPKFPFVPGTDIAGEVVSLGPGTEKSFAVGDQVFGALDVPSGGAFAEYATLNVKIAAKRPSEISPETAACFPVAALTALQALRNFGGVKIDGSYKGNILIAGASGGVGTYAVQIAKLAGAHVTATCSERNFALVKELGADEVLDYRSPEGAEWKSPSGKLYDVILDATQKGDSSWTMTQKVLTANGKCVNLLPKPKTLALSAASALSFFGGKKLLSCVLLPTAEDLSYVAALAKEGKLKTIVDSSHEFKSAGEAWAKSKEGHATGKVVVTMAAPPPPPPRPASTRIEEAVKAPLGAMERLGKALGVTGTGNH